MNKKKFNVILYNPQIPPNTGNIIRLCSNTDSNLHLIKPFGFELNNKTLKRAGLDYYNNVSIFQHNNLDDCLQKIKNKNTYLITKFGKTQYTDAKFRRGDNLIFGSEINGIPKKIHERFNENHKLFIPMAKNSRCLNLSNAVSICLYEAWRQVNFN